MSLREIVGFLVLFCRGYFLEAFSDGFRTFLGTISPRLLIPTVFLLCECRSIVACCLLNKIVVVDSPPLVQVSLKLMKKLFLRELLVC